jgi:hypothetical protein
MLDTGFFARWLGPFRLLRRYHPPPPRSPERDELGRLYEASHLLSDNPALVLIPSEHAPMEPRDEWRVRLRAQSHPPVLSLEVERAPPFGHLSQLRGMLSLLASCVERIEEDGRARDHLTHPPLGPLGFLYMVTLALWGWMRSHPWRTLGLGVLGAFLLPLGALLQELPPFLQAEARFRNARSNAIHAFLGGDAPTLARFADEHAATISYPLPSRPFRNQARAPCNPRQGQVEINGGCWVELAKRPPCHDDQAEYQGKCYLPVAPPAREPQALQP